MKKPARADCDTDYRWFEPQKNDLEPLEVFDLNPIKSSILGPDGEPILKTTTRPIGFVIFNTRTTA